MSKHKLDQKRLEALRRQLYGQEKSTKKITRKEVPSLDTINKPTESIARSQFLNKFNLKPNTVTKDPDSQTQAIYLKKDLFKILTLSSLALIAQVLLYFGLRNNLLNLSFIK